MRILTLVAVALAVLGAAVPARADSCVDCHRKLDQPRLSEPTTHFAQDVHARHGIGCVGCHGGNPDDPEETAMDPERGFRPAPSRREIADLCVSCHADAAYMKRFNPRPYVFSMSEYRTSVHRVREEKGDSRTATCTSCHGVHGILSHRDPASPVFDRNVPGTCAKCHNADYMKGRGIKTDQYEHYRGSVHGIALLEKGDASAPACNDCHGNHGAAPPGVQGVTLVCGTCHGRVAELFNASRMKAGMDRDGKHGCVACHGNHAVGNPGDELLAVGDPGWCGNCHEPGSEAEKQALSIIEGFHGLKSDMTRADSLLKAAEVLGMETTAGRSFLKEAEDQVIGARAVMHSFDAKTVNAVIDEGRSLVDKARGAADGALRDWHQRRQGMAVSLVVILALIVLLVMKIRSLERT